MNIWRTASLAFVLLWVSLLTACSGGGDSASAITTAPPANAAVVANAGPDQSVFVGTFVTLDGSHSVSSQGGTVTYRWTLRTPAGSSATLSSATVVDPTLTVDIGGMYEATLTVTDGTLSSAPDTVFIIVGVTNGPPAAVITEHPHALFLAPVTLDGSGSNDANRDLLAFRWKVVGAPANSTFLTNPTAFTFGDTAAPVFTPDKIGLYRVQLIVNDGILDSPPAEITISSEDKPGPTANAGLPQTFAPSVGNPTTVSLAGSGTKLILNSDGSTTTSTAGLTYSWQLSPQGSSPIPTSMTGPIRLVGQPAPTPADSPTAGFAIAARQTGTYVATLTVTESDHPNPSRRTALATVLIRISPIAVALPDVSRVAPNSTLTFTGGTSVGAAPLTYQWRISFVPASGGRQLFFRFPYSTSENAVVPGAEAGTYTATLTVKDAIWPTILDPELANGHTASDSATFVVSNGPTINQISLPAFSSPFISGQSASQLFLPQPTQLNGWAFPGGRFISPNVPIITATATFSGLVGAPTCDWSSSSPTAVSVSIQTCTAEQSTAAISASTVGTHSLTFTVTDGSTGDVTPQEFTVRVATPPTITLTPKIVTPVAGTNNETTSTLSLTDQTEPAVCRKVTIDAAVSGTTIQPTWTITAPTPPGRRRNGYPNDGLTGTSFDGYRSTVNNPTIGVRFYNGTTTGRLDPVQNEAAFTPTTGTAASSSKFRTDVPGDFVVTASVKTLDTLETQASVTLKAKSQKILSDNGLNNNLHTTLLNLRNSSCGSCHNIGMWGVNSSTALYPDHSGRGLALFHKFNSNGSAASHNFTTVYSLGSSATREDFCALFNDFP